MISGSQESIIHALIDCHVSSSMQNSHTASRLMDDAPRSSFCELLAGLIIMRLGMNLVPFMPRYGLRGFTAISTFLKESQEI